MMRRGAPAAPAGRGAPVAGEEFCVGALFDDSSLIDDEDEGRRTRRWRARLHGRCVDAKTKVLIEVKAFA